MTPETALVVVRVLVYADLLILFGLSLFAVYGLSTPKEAIEVLRLRRWAILLAAGGLALSFVHLAAMTAAMTGAGMLDVGRDAIVAVINADGMGTAWLTRMIALVLVLPAASVLPTRPTFALSGTIGCSAVALATLAWAGHGSMNTGALGWGHLGADLLHLLAAAGWLGALVALLILLFDRRVVSDRQHVTRLHKALRDFSTMGTVFVATILVTGIVNVASVVGWVPIRSWVESTYGRLLIAKVGLFVVMLSLAAANRFWLSPALSRASYAPDTRVAVRALRFSLSLEIFAAAFVLLIVAALGTLAPPR